MSAFKKRLSRDLAIDLGTANTLVWAEGKGIVLEEPSVVAVHRSESGAYGDVLAVGAEAKEMLGRTPGSIVAVRPLKDGVIADFHVTEEMLRAFIRRAIGRSPMVKPLVLVCIPFGLTEVEKRAVYESARSAGAREVQLISEPMAAALGAGMPVLEPVGNLVVDIGGGTSEIAVLSLGGAVQSKSLRVAGDHLNSAIATVVQNEHGIYIGERTAEALKLDVGTALPQRPPLVTVVKGRDRVSGIPRQVHVSSEEIRHAIQPLLRKLVEAIREVLESTPPELAGDILQRGMVLCGGGALLRGLDQYLADETGLPVVLADDPLRSVVKGAGRALEDASLSERVVLR
ncbi:MAG: rod shape-determining protein [Myxococcota bacterium]|nr:rod shape-determining protein [Myxococcota bacterium]